jgi:hypothetical protein
MTAARCVVLSACAALGCSEIAGVRSLSPFAGDAAVEASSFDAGRCTDVTQDPTNCGACGHSCAGGACKGGACAPVALGKVPDTGDVTLAVDGRRVFVGIVNGQVLAMPVSGGDLTSLAVPSSLQSVAVDAVDLFLATGTQVLRCAAKSCALPETVAGSLSDPGGVATVGDDVYFAAGTSLLRAPRGGGATTVAASARPVAFVAAASALTFSLPDGIYRCPAGGCGSVAPTRIAVAVAAGSLAVAGSDVLWLDGTALRRAAVPDPPGPAAPQDLTTVGPAAESLVASASRVFWSERGARVAACPRAGGVAVTLAAGDDAPATGLVADAASLYWVTADRRVMRLAQ